MKRTAIGCLLLLLLTVGCGQPAPAGTESTAAAPPPAPSSSGCQPTLPAIPTGNRPPGMEVMLVDPAPAYWGVNLPEGDPLPLEGSVDLQPLHVKVAHRFDPQIKVNQKVDAQIYLIFPRNDFTVKPPKTGWVEQPGSDATVVWCGEVHGQPALTPGENDKVFWLTALASRPFPIQWQVAGTSESGPISPRLRGFSLAVTP